MELLDIRFFLRNNGDVDNNINESHCCFQFMGCKSKINVPYPSGHDKIYERYGWNTIVINQYGSSKIWVYCCATCSNKLIDQKLMDIVGDNQGEG